MMQEEYVTSPLSASNISMQDMPKQLTAEISDGLYNLRDGKRWLIETEINQLKGKARSDAELNLSLFRQYSEAANRIREHNIDLESRVTIPTILPAAGNDSRLLAGLNALRSNLFWLRLIAGTFSLISFMVMLWIPNFDHAHWAPGESFTCSEQLSGSFKLRQYHFVIAVGVFIFAHAMITSTYYLLPVDAQNEKYIPGLRSAFMSFVGNDEIADEVMTSAHGCFSCVTRFLECFVDFALVVMSLVAFIIAAVCLDQPSQFSANDKVVYYTLPSFWATYSHTSPVCVNGDNDPTVNVRASLSMLFFAFLAMVLCLQVSYRAARTEWSENTRRSGADTPYSREEGTHFLTQPVASADSQHDRVHSSAHGSAGRRGCPNKHQRHQPQRRAGTNSNGNGSAGDAEGEEDEEEEEEEAITFRAPTTV